MNRGSVFHMPTVSEWVRFNVHTLRKSDFRLPRPDSENDTAPCGIYVLTNYMPALSLSLTSPSLTWCIDVNLSDRYETRVNVGSSYFVTDRCVLGPTVLFSDADRRASDYMGNFANDVTNGLRWILEIYRTTNVLEKNDFYDVDVAVARNMRSKVPFGNYAPVRLTTRLRESSECEEIPIDAVSDGKTYVRPFESGSGAAAPVGGAGQFARPYLGTAWVQRGFCPTDPVVAVRDPYAMNANDRTRLEEMIAKSREEVTRRYYGNRFRSTDRSDGTTRSGDHAGEPMETDTAVPTTGAAVPTFPQPPSDTPAHTEQGIRSTDANVQMFDTGSLIGEFVLDGV